ncbi:hypothetical protein FQA39_LY07125 [Lamprigera yunnana]|nr:hypothetical protein FQA39_LY07125 [Lamprigera yunnana]
MMLRSVVFIILTAYCNIKITNAGIINKNVERVIDLSSQLVKISAVITLENTGKVAESKYLLMLEPNALLNLSYISAKDSYKHEVKVIENSNGNGKVFSVQLNQPVTPSRTTTINVEYILTNSLVPYPSSIIQKEKQLVRYFGNHYFYSPYPTVKQTTSVIVNTRSIENYSKLKPVSQSDSSIMYGPYSEITPFTIDAMVVHFESTAPFLTVTRLERLIEVSHWGNIAVEENIDILHTGAKLKGSFSRYDYQRDTNNNHHSIKSYKTILPAAAHSVYYRDGNGNISTSQVRMRKEWIELELRPRYPLFGGWRSSYILGYSVPSYQYLYKGENNLYALRMRLIDNVFDDMHVEHLETSVVLPVGVTNIKLNTPYQIERLPDSITYKYLDTKDLLYDVETKTNSKTLTFEMIEEKKILRIEDVCGNEVYLGWESVSEVWSLQTVLRYRLSYSSGSNIKHFYDDVIRAVAEMSGNLKINIYNIVNRLSEKSDDVCCMLEIILFMPEKALFDVQLKRRIQEQEIQFIKKMWMLYAEQHWTKAIYLKSAVECLYEKLGALEFDADHEAIYGMEKYYTVEQCEMLRDKYKIGRKVCRQLLKGKMCSQCFVKRISDIGLQHFLDTISKYIKDCSDSDTSSYLSDEEECKEAVKQNGEDSKTKEEEESKKSEGGRNTKSFL